MLQCRGSKFGWRSLRQAIEESVAEGVSVKVLTGVAVAKELCVMPSDGGVAVGVGVGAAAALPGGT